MVSAGPALPGGQALEVTFCLLTVTGPNSEKAYC